MALVVKDRVKESTTTSGTGTLTLAGAVTGFQSFATALSDGDTTYYAIAESSTGAWEVGLGTWATGSSTLARTTVFDSSNGGSAVNLSGAGADVFITQPADKAAYFDASGDLALNQDPTAALQAATKQYVDSIAAAGIHYHTPVRVEKEGNLNVTYDNGTAGVGATLTNAGTQEALVIDGVTMVVDDRVLVYEQSDATQNGVYTVTNVGSGSTNWVLTRATDADSYSPSDPDSLGQGDAFFVQEGAAGAGETYVMNTEGTITFGTTDITFVQFSSAQIYSAGDGLTLTGVTFAAGAGTGVTVNANDIAIGQDVGTTADVTFNTVTADLTGAVTGNASTASALETARNIALTGAVTGSTSFDGSGNVSITTTATSDPTITLGGDLSGSATLTNLGNATLTATINANSVALGTDTTGNYVGAGATSGNGISGAVSSEGGTFTVTSNATNANTGSTIVFRDASGNFSAGTITAALSGNATNISQYTINQNVGTGNSVSFAGVNINGNLNAVDDIYLADQIIHEGDTDTYMQFHAANQWRVVTGGVERLEVTNSGVRIDDAFTLPTTDGSADQVLKTNGSGTVTWGDAGGGVATNYNQYTSSGTWTKPSDATWVYVEVVGGGGGGAGASFAGDRTQGAGGGMFTYKLFRASDLGSTETVTIGAGGSGGSQDRGTDGGSSTFGSHLEALGGKRGERSGGASAIFAGNFSSTEFGYAHYLEHGSYGGYGNGAYGAAGGGKCVYGGGGGGSNRGSGSGSSTPTEGGTSLYGGDGGDGGNSSTAPQDGSVPGGGGGGSYNSSDSGGDGGDGRIRVWSW